MCWDRRHLSGFLRRALWRKWDWHVQSKWYEGYAFNIILWAHRDLIAAFIYHSSNFCFMGSHSFGWNTEGEQVELLCSMGLLEFCCESASSFPKNRFFFFTPNICFWAQVQEETCYLNGIILQLGSSPSILKHFFISKGEKWAFASLLCIFGFRVLVFGLVGSPPLTPLKIKDGRKLSFLCMKNSDPLCSAKLSGEFVHACPS